MLLEKGLIQQPIEINFGSSRGQCPGVPETNMERSLESSGKVPRIVQVMCFKDFSRPSANQQAEQSLPQVWEAQWQQVLNMLQHSHAGWGNPQLAEAVPWDDTKAFLSAFEQVAEVCRWPREEWVGRLLPGLRGGMEQIYCNLDARERGDYGKVKAALLRGDAMWTESKRQHFRQCCYQDFEGPRRIYGRLQELCRQWLKPDHRSKEQILELIIQEQLLAMLPTEVQNWVRECGPEDCIDTVALAEDFLMGRRQAARTWKWPDVTVSSSEAEGALADTMARHHHAGIRQKRDGELRLANERMPTRNSGFMLPPERQETAGASLPEGLANLRERSVALERAGWTTVDLDQKPLPWEITQENCGNVNSSEGVVVPAPNIISQPDQGHFFSHITETGETITSVIPNGKVLCEIKVENDEEGDSDTEDSFEAPTEESPEAALTSSEIDEESPGRTLRPREPQRAKPGRPKKRGTRMRLRKKSVLAAPKRPKEKKHKCSQCEHRTYYWSDMLRHMNTHNGKRPHKCPDCGRTFTHLSSLQTHQKIHVPAPRLKSLKKKVGKKILGRLGVGIYLCSKCGKRVRTMSAFAEHMRIHSGQGIYQCQECGRSFQWMSSLCRHWRDSGCFGIPKRAVKDRAVGGDSAHQEEADSKDGLAALLEKTLGTLSRAPGACEASLTSRLRPRKPQGVMPETSGARASVQSSMGQRKKITCPECGYRSAELSELANHMRIHTGKRPYKCQNCGSTFGWLKNFFEHCQAGCTCGERQATHTGDEELCKVKQEEIKTEDEFGMWPGEAPALAECDVILEDEEELIHILERNPQKGEGGLLGTLRERSTDTASVSTENSETGALPKWSPRVLRVREHQGTSARSQKTAVVAKHKGYKEKQRKHKCSVCGHRTFYLSDLMRHMRVHTGERPFKCLECNRTFTQSSALRFHQRRVHQAGRGPSNRNRLVKNVPSHKGENGPTGRKRGRKLAGLVKRVRKHVAEEPFKCAECGRGFRWASNLCRHRKLHKTNSKTPPSGRQKTDAGSRKPSKMVVENPLRRRADLKRESGTSAEITQGVASVTVVINDGAWKSRSSKKLDEGNPAPVGRPLCSKSAAAYRYKSRLVASQKTLAIKKHQCGVCRKSFRFKHYLKDHGNIHTGAKPYKCYKCDKTFGFRTKLQRHQKIHTGVKPYQCPECEKAFFRKETLMIHLTSHRSSCMYACSHCGRRFMEREQLFRHQQSHVGQ